MYKNELYHKGPEKNNNDIFYLQRKKRQTKLCQNKMQEDVKYEKIKQ
jgi:hypothetical protein